MTLMAAAAVLPLLLYIRRYYPDVVFEDKTLLAATRYTKADSDFGKGSRILVFADSNVHVRRGDGAAIMVNVSPYPAMLHALVRKGAWDKALRLCRFTSDPTLWACLAAMAMAGQELATAEAAFAAIDEVDKLHFAGKLRQIPSEEGRAAELALYRHRPDEAEAILLQAGLTYRAIKMHIKLCAWERALELAQAHGAHVDTVLMYRARHLAAAGQRESLPAFQRAASEVSVDEAAVRQRIQQEKAAEAGRPGARRYVSAVA